jgi:glycosyltransferase involved in cell wall biosynthesis
LTTHTYDNAALVQQYWGREATVVRYGLNTDDFPVTAVTDWRPHTPLRIAAIGNDRDRDWDTLITAFENDARYSVRVATRRKIWRRVKADNVVVAPVHGLAAQRALYEWADVIVVPLHPNHHVSGITVILESVAFGKPVIATAGGGLEDYFSGRSIWYVPPHNPDALRQRVASLADQPDTATEQMRRAQQEFLSRDLTTQAFARQHVTLTRSLMQREGRPGIDFLPRSET